MRNLKKAACGMAALTLAVIVTGCGGTTEVTGESLLDEFALQRISAKSVSMTMTTEIDTALHFEGINDVKMHHLVTSAVDTVGQDAHIVCTTQSDSPSDATEPEVTQQEKYYIFDTAASEKTGYVLDTKDPVMYKLNDPDYVYPTDVLDLKSSITNMTLSNATASFNGVECYEIDGRMTWDTFRTTIGQDTVWVVPDIEEGVVLSDITFDVKLFFAKEDHKFEGMSTDALSPLNTVISRSVAKNENPQTVKKVTVTVTDIAFNTGKTVALPADREIIE